MKAFPITARNLALRLGTVARDLELEPDAIELFASIAGVRIALQSTTFQVDDDGTLLFLNGFESFLAELQAQVKEAEQNLVNECNRYNDLWLSFEGLKAASNQLCGEMAVMCEAQLAGDHDLVKRKVEQFTEGYVKNFNPVAAGGSVP